MLQAKNGSLSLEGSYMDYVRFGAGSRTLILIPGVGDGLKTVKGMALPFALLYRKLAKDFTVYLFSRRQDLPPHCGTREMAEDLSRAMDALQLRGACVVGVSQGGMIAQWLAIDHPEAVSRLILTVTASHSNPTMRDVIGRWLAMAEQGDYAGILLDTALRSYTPRRLRLLRPSYALLGAVSKPKSLARFRTQAEACLSHDAYGALPDIACPTLVVGGTEDQIVTGEASRELAGQIPGAKLYLYAGLGHALYEEAPDYLDRVIAFCR